MCNRLRSYIIVIIIVISIIIFVIASLLLSLSGVDFIIIIALHCTEQRFWQYCGCPEAVLFHIYSCFLCFCVFLFSITESPIITPTTKRGGKSNK